VSSDYPKCRLCGANHAGTAHVWTDEPKRKAVAASKAEPVLTVPDVVLTDTNDGVNNGVNAIDGGVNRSSDRHSAGYMQAYMARRRAKA